MIDYIRRKIHEISHLHNVFSGDLSISRSAYTSGSTISGTVSIGDAVKIYQSHIEGRVNIGRYTSLWGPNIHVYGRLNGVSIGNFCSIARNVSIQEDYHNPKRTTTYLIERNLLHSNETITATASKGPIHIGHDVWIGAGAHVLSGVKIGNGAIIGAGAVVTKDVPAYGIAVGNPAQVRDFRFNSDMVQELNDSEWWDWPVDKLKANAEFFTMVHDR